MLMEDVKKTQIQVVVDHEEEELQMTVQMEINHLLVTMEHVMLQVEDEMMKK